MISIRKYLNSADEEPSSPSPSVLPGGAPSHQGDLLNVSLSSYRSALAAMGQCSIDACPAEGVALDQKLTHICEQISQTPAAESLAAAGVSVQAELRDWGHRTARHYRHKAGEVKQILLAMAQTAESVGQRDERCARQIDEVTRKLRRIASLDDISLIRSSIERSAAELKESIHRITAEGRDVLQRMQAQVTTFQAKLEEAEQIASIDALTRLRSRMAVEGQLEQRIAAAAPFCVAILDVNGFKGVNDEHGHLVGDALLKQFAGELKSACRVTDVVGRWGGDEFLIVLDGERTQAEAQIERVRKWVCGQYTVDASTAPLKLTVGASIGLAEWTQPETLPQLLQRADAAMYENKAAQRPRRG